MKAYAKVNLALVVGERRPDGLHEVATVLQRIDLADDVHLEEADRLTVEGFAEDTLVRTALERLASAAGVEPRWRVRIEKRIPVAAGLGGGPGFEERRKALTDALWRRDLAGLPPNDLAGAAGGAEPAVRLRAAGAFRADVSGAGPSVFGLFAERAAAEAAARDLVPAAQVWVLKPVW